MFYELASSSWDDKEIAAINRIIESDRYTMGPEVAAFEDEFAAYHGKKYGVMVNSGSSANLIAVAAQFFKKKNPLKRGDEVIVPAVSWATTYHPLQQYGLKLKIVDIELETLNMDVSQLEEALTLDTKMLVAVSILGNPCELDVMRAFCDKHDLIFMEDNCESLDAELNSKKAGSFGDVNTSSFFFSHHIATMEGGMIITDDLETYHLMRCLRAHGWTRDIPKDSPIFESRGDDFFEAYRFILPGYNVRPTEMAGAIGREQLKKLPAMTAARRKNLALFNELFGDDERFIIQRENGQHSSFCFPIILNPDLNIDREQVFKALVDADIGYRIITGGCILRHDVMKFYDYETVGEIANSNSAHDNGFFCGNQAHDIAPQLRKLHEVLDASAQPA